MAIIPPETIEAVSAATDIVELISTYIPLTRAGGQYKSTCPFHDERTPSFNVSPQRQAYHCFGCGESGDAITFVMKYENLPFTDAVRRLALAAGIPIIEDAYDPKEDKKKRYRSRLTTLHNEATQFMHDSLMKSPNAKIGRDYLQSRGFNAEMAKRWKIGWMPDNQATFSNWAKSKEYKAKELVDASLAGVRDENNPSRGVYIKFTNRLMFPIYNDYGDVIAFSGRQLVEDAKSGKYVNSNETMLFKKSKVFFGLDKAKKAIGKKGFAILTEGQMDVIACSEAGLENTIAGLGTALTEDHAQILKRFTKNVVICYDSDNAGNKAVEKAFEVLIKKEISVKVVIMPRGEDPDTLIKKEGLEAFQSRVENAVDFFDFKFSIASEELDLNDLQVKSQFAAKLASLVALMPDKISKDSYIQQISAQLSIGSSEFRDNVTSGEKQSARQSKLPKKIYNSKVAEVEAEASPPIFQIDNIIASLCIYALYSNNSLNYLSEQLEAMEDSIKETMGGSLLLKILANRPQCETPAALHSYLHTLETAERNAIAPTLAKALPEDILNATEETANLLINTHLQKRDNAIRAMLRRTDLTSEEKNTLLVEVQEISNLLAGLEQRFIR